MAVVMDGAGEACTDWRAAAGLGGGSFDGCAAAGGAQERVANGSPRWRPISGAHRELRVYWLQRRPGFGGAACGRSTGVATSATSLSAGPTQAATPVAIAASEITAHRLRGVTAPQAPQVAGCWRCWVFTHSAS